MDSCVFSLSAKWADHEELLPGAEGALDTLTSAPLQAREESFHFHAVSYRCGNWGMFLTGLLPWPLGFGFMGFSFILVKLFVYDCTFMFLRDVDREAEL